MSSSEPVSLSSETYARLLAEQQASTVAQQQAGAVEALQQSARTGKPSIVQVEAAKLRLVTDRRLGKKSPEWVKRVAKGLPVIALNGVAGTSMSATDQIAHAKHLLDMGTIAQAEFDQLKANALDRVNAAPHTSA